MPSDLILFLVGKLTEDKKRAIATGWRGSGMSQVVYAAQHQIPIRTLRSWIARYSPTPPTPAHVRQALVEIRSKVDALVAGLDAADRPQTRPAAACHPDGGPTAGAAELQPVEMQKAEARNTAAEPAAPKRLSKIDWDSLFDES